jgi:hypothetical protein
METKLKKIHLESLIQALTLIYNEGADFVDLEIDHNPLRDRITILTTKEYYKNVPPPRKLSQEELNQLI